MKIPILNSLETKQQWSAFNKQKAAYAYISNPLSLVDFQTSFIQITDINKNLSDGRQATKYSLGDKRSNKAAWELIESCNWSLKKLLAGLKQLDFDSNVRDNSTLNLHSNITIRQFFSKDKCVISPLLLQQLQPIQKPPKKWQLLDVKSLLSNDQYRDLTWLSNNLSNNLPNKSELNSVKAVIIQLVCHPELWRIIMQKEHIVLSFNSTLILQFAPLIQAKPLLLK